MDTGKSTRLPGVRRLKDGRFVVVAQVTRGGTQRKRRQIGPPGETLEQAAVRHAQLVEVLATGLEPEPAPETLGGYAKSWLRRKTSEVRKRTAKDYARSLTEWLLPYLGERKIDTLTRADVLAWRSWMEGAAMTDGRPYSTASLRLHWRVGVGLLGDLDADLGRGRVLTYRAKPPTSKRQGRNREAASLTLPEVRRLLAVVLERWPQWHAEVHTVVWSGLRPSELYALRRMDVDTKAGFILVRRSVSKGVVTEATKSSKPRRVELTGEMVSVLRAHLEGTTGLPTALVFPGEKGKYRGDTALYHLLRDAADAAGIGVRVGPQVLRYTHNTLLREAGVSDQVVRARLGHATTEMGHVYYHGSDGAQRAAVEGLDGQLLDTTGRTPTAAEQARDGGTLPESATIAEGFAGADDRT